MRQDFIWQFYHFRLSGLQLQVDSFKMSKGYEKVVFRILLTNSDAAFLTAYHRRTPTRHSFLAARMAENMIELQTYKDYIKAQKIIKRLHGNQYMPSKASLLRCFNNRGVIL